MNLSSIKELRIIKTDTQFERTNYRVLASYTDIGVYSNGYVGNITTASEHSINDALKHFNELSDILVKDICYVSIRRKEGDRYQVFYRYDTGEHAKTQFVHVNYRGDLLSKLSEYFNITLEELGFTDVSLCYRISFSQGDHVKTNGDISFADAVKLTGYKLSVLKTKIIDDWVELEITGSRVNVSWYYDRDLNYVDATVAAVVRELEDWIERNDKAIYRRLSDESKRADLEAFPDTWYFENGIRALI